MASTSAIGWPSAVVAVALIALIGAVMVVAIWRYPLAEALKVWGALGTILGVVVGVMTTYFFTHRTIATLENRLANAQIAGDEHVPVYAFGATVGTLSTPKDLDTWRALLDVTIDWLEEKSQAPGKNQARLEQMGTAIRVLLWPDELRKALAFLDKKAEADQPELTEQEAANRNYFGARKRLAAALDRALRTGE